MLIFWYVRKYWVGLSRRDSDFGIYDIWRRSSTFSICTILGKSLTCCIAFSRSQVGRAVTIWNVIDCHGEVKMCSWAFPFATIKYSSPEVTPWPLCLTIMWPGPTIEIMECGLTLSLQDQIGENKQSQSWRMTEKPTQSLSVIPGQVRTSASHSRVHTMGINYMEVF